MTARYQSIQLSSEDLAAESLEQRIERLRLFIDSPRYGITEEYVTQDYESGRNRCAYPGVPRLIRIDDWP